MKMESTLIYLAVVLGVAFGSVIPDDHRMMARQQERYQRYIDHMNHVRASFERKQVCYDTVGCFSNAAPYDNSLGYLPEDPTELAHRFFLYTRENREKYDLVHYSDPASVQNSHYSPTRDTRIVIHGLGGHGNLDWVQGIVSETLNLVDVNVIAVDWEAGAAGINYWQAVANVRIVGAEVAQLVNVINDVTGSTIKQFHLVGHSLGGQVAGAAGSALPGLPRITGLDPAAPWFEDEDPAVRLDPTDAGLVDILHTNGGPWWLGYVGISARHGHVDIYPNGGVIQPGCKKPAAGALEAILSGELLEVFQDLAGCSHKRSTVLYIDMLKKGSCPYIAVECSSYEDFEAGACSEGRVIDLTNVENEGFSGAGYMDTFAQTPYCGYHYVVAASVSADSSSPKGEIKLTLTSSKGQQTTALLVDGTIKAGTTQSVTHLSDTQLADVTAADVSYERTSIMQANTFVIDRLTVMSYRDSDWWSVCNTYTVSSGQSTQTELFPGICF